MLTPAITRILLVEDQAIPAKVTIHQLSSLGCQVDHAPNGQTALTLAQQQHYDLIFMDIGLPDISGLEVTKQIRAYEIAQQKIPAPIIALTAHVDGEEKQICIEAGMNRVITKPITKEIAEEILHACIVSTENNARAA